MDQALYFFKWRRKAARMAVMPRQHCVLKLQSDPRRITLEQYCSLVDAFRQHSSCRC